VQNLDKFFLTIVVTQVSGVMVTGLQVNQISIDFIGLEYVSRPVPAERCARPL
jgi:hypothetical protein